MTIIYCIEDINNNKYVGSTKQKLESRFSAHIRDKRNLKKRQCSSIKLNLENSIIYQLEECEEQDRYERENYWINKINCVNIKNATFDKKKYKNALNKYQRSWAIACKYNNLLDIDISFFD